MTVVVREIFDKMYVVIKVLFTKRLDLVMKGVKSFKDNEYV